MDSWIFQGGHPIVEADLVGDSTLRLRQERFRTSAAVDPDGPASAEGLGDVWAVPVSLLVGGADGSTARRRLLLEERELDVELDTAPSWVLVNAGADGFYRVRYSARLREALIAHGIGELAVLERYALLDDAFAAVVAGSMPAAEFLDLTRAYGDETDVAVWRRLAAALQELYRLVDGEAADAFRARVRALAGPALRRVGFAAAAGEDDRTRDLRGTLLTTAAVLGGDDGAIAEARRLRAAELAEPGSVDPALAGAATTIAAEVGGPDEFETALARYRAAATPQEEVRELYALARFHHGELIDRLLELALTEIRTQNAPYVLRIGLENRTEGRRVWEFIRRNWAAMNERYPSNSIVRMLEGITALTDEAVAADVAAFFAEHEVPQGAQQLRQHLERQRAGVALRAREAGSLS